MKFFLAILVSVVAAALIAWGMVLALKGNFWLLGICILVYTAAFVKIGCADH